MYSYNFEEQLDQRKLTILLLSFVIPTDTDVLKDIYENKRKLENRDINQHYQNTFNYTISEAYKLCRSGEHPNVDVRDLFTKKHRMLLRQIRCLQEGFIVYETVDYDDEEEYEYNKFINLKPLTGQTEPEDCSEENKRKIPQGIKIINRIFKEYEKYNPEKVDKDYRAEYLQDKVDWAYKLGGDDEPEKFQITGDQYLNTTLDKRQKDFNDMCIMGYDIYNTRIMNNNMDNYNGQFRYSILISEIHNYIFMC